MVVRQQSHLGTKLVVLHSNSADPKNVDFEIWTEVDNQSLDPNTRNHQAKILRHTQKASFVGGSLEGAPLTLNFELYASAAAKWK